MTKPKKQTQTAETLAVELKCDVAALVIRGMARKKWTKEDLAKAVAQSPATIDAIVYARRDNLSVGFIGRILHALDMEATLVRYLR